jgi:hypothetical protein
MRAYRRNALALLFGCAAGMGASDPAFAHAFGQRYELPVPVWLFVVGGALTVTVTFVMVALFAKGGADRYAEARLDLGRFALGRVLAHGWVRACVRALGVAALALVLAVGFFGPADPNANPAPVAVWVAWWVGFSYLVMLAGNLWPLVNPWRTLFDAFGPRAPVGAHHMTRAGIRPRAPVGAHHMTRAGIRPRARSFWPYPARWGAWPAVGLLIVFFWFELIFPFVAMPGTLAFLIVLYSVVTWVGMAVWGPEAWLANVDPIHRVFDLYGRFSPLAWEKARGGLVLRPYAAAMLRRSEVGAPAAIAAFVIALLTGVLFDALLGSGHWTQIENTVHGFYPKLGDVGWIAVHTVGFLALWLFVLGLFFATCWSMARMAGGGLGTLDHARAFALTLIPIAVGYHFAHTFTYLLVQGQSIIPLVSDSFGLGWNLFGTRAYRIDIAVMTTKSAWNLAVAATVIGHSVSVYLAHVVADRLLASRARAFRALVPMTVLMVIYTIVSLQILAEPLVRYSGPQETVI